MNNPLEDHKETVSTGGKTIANLTAASLVDRLDKTSSTVCMEISVEKTKLMTNNTDGISIDIRVNGKTLDQQDIF